MSIRILHIEVGGTYGGSLRALELYLRYARRNDLIHDVLLYYPTPNAGSLNQLGCSVRVLHPNLPTWIAQGTQRQSGLRGKLRRFALGGIPLEAKEWAQVVADAGTVRRLRRAFQAEHYDLIHVNNTFSYQAQSIVAARSCGLPVLGHVRNPVPGSLRNRMLAQALTAAVTVSENYTRELRARYSRLSIHTCHDGVEAPVPERAAAAALRADLLGDGKVLIGAAGRLDHQKGYQDLLTAAGTVCQQNPQVRFAIAGDGPLRGELERRIADLGLGNRVRLCGFRSDIANFLSALDICVNSSLWEGLPVAVLEAMLLGKYVAATDVGGISEVVRSSRIGILVRPGAPAALAAALISAAGEIPLEEERRREIATTAAEISDPARNAAELDEILVKYQRGVTADGMGRIRAERRTTQATDEG